MSDSNNSGSVILGTLIGAAVGFAAGILLAPASGKETRENLSEKANDMSRKISDATDQALDSIKELKESAEKSLRKEVEAKKAWALLMLYFAAALLTPGRVLFAIYEKTAAFFWEPAKSGEKLPAKWAGDFAFACLGRYCLVAGPSLRGYFSNNLFQHYAGLGGPMAGLLALFPYG